MDVFDQHMTSLRSLYLRVACLGEGIGLLFPAFSELPPFSFINLWPEEEEEEEDEVEEY